MPETIFEASERYETWLKTQCDVVAEDLVEKHRLMAKNAFRFLRATCYRFARRFGGILPELAGLMAVPSVGDAHIENFGTWRDGEGRLVWGINDFDEAAILPWPSDLVRLATSARLGKDLPGTKRGRAAAILEGYISSLDAPGPQFVDDENPSLQALVLRPGEVGQFRGELGEIHDDTPPPSAILDLLEAAMPPGAIIRRKGSWQKGGGSLGRPRYVAVATWQGGPAVREAKALAPSAWDWAAGRGGDPGLFTTLATGPYRSPDPFLKVAVVDGRRWVVRRIAADSVKIDLGEAAAQVYGPQLLSAMGRELAAVHVTQGANPGTILTQMRSLPEDWLHDAARTAEQDVTADFERWQAHAVDE